MRPIRYTYAPTALDRDGLAQSQTPAGAGSFTMNGALVTAGVLTVGAPQFLTAYSASNISNRTITFTGVDYNGNAYSETITGPNNATVSTSASFGSGAIAATISGAAAGAIELGVSGIGNGNPLPLDFHRDAISTSVAVKINSGSPTYTVQHTFDDVFSRTFDPATAVWYNHDDTALVAATANANSNYLAPPTAARINLAVTGSVTLTLIQQGI